MSRLENSVKKVILLVSSLFKEETGIQGSREVDKILRAH